MIYIDTMSGSLTINTEVELQKGDIIISRDAAGMYIRKSNKKKANTGEPAVWLSGETKQELL